MADEQFILTPAGYQQLQDEIRDLEAELADRRAVRSEGEDDRDNQSGNDEAAVFETQTSMEHLTERINHLKFVLERADVRTEDANPRKVDPGERVVVWDMDAKEELTFDLLSAPEAQQTYTTDDGGANIAVDSPVGQALIGHKVGDVVTVEVPDGKVRYAIRKIGEVKS
jgi:transcription elongation factor GreA